VSRVRKCVDCRIGVKPRVVRELLGLGVGTAVTPDDVRTDE